MTGPREPRGAAPPAAVYVGGTAIPLAPGRPDLFATGSSSPTNVPATVTRGRAGAAHDNQWLLSWAVNDVLGATDLGEQVQWLARVLHARDFPVDRLARDLETAAEIVVNGALGYVSKPVAARRCRPPRRSPGSTSRPIPLPLGAPNAAAYSPSRPVPGGVRVWPREGFTPCD
jgi:hypothetical protein